MTITGVIVDETVTISITEVCHKYTLSEEALIEMIEHGLFKSPIAIEKNSQLDVTAVRRLESALRLQRDLGVNVPGAVLVLELSDELEQLRNELNFLRRYLAE